MITYNEWTTRLRGHFFSPENAGIPVTLFVDADVVADVGGFSDAAAAERSLVSAVRMKLLPESSGDIFRRVVDESWGWRFRNSDQDPPFLPVLAICVLAAAKMAVTELWSAQNYYEPLRELLGLRHGKGMPSGYDAAMVALWGHLTWWLNERNGGSLGLSTVPQRPYPPYVGYAQSQALFRESDRQRLTFFFNALEISPGEEIDAAELLMYFESWCHRSHLSRGAMEMARRPEYSEVLGSILSAELRRWDGTLRDDRGRRVGHILVLLDLYLRPKLSFVAERPPGFPAAGVFDFGDPFGKVPLAAVSDGYYGELPIRVSPEALESGLRGLHDGIGLTFAPSPALPLRQDPALGGWTSARQLLPGEQHWILARADQAGAVRDYLREAAMVGWRETLGIAPKGWTFFRDVVVEAAEAAAGGPALSRIVPLVRERPSLWGGLPIPTRLGDYYLVGGEPDVWVPPTPDEAIVPVLIDGQKLPIAFRGGRLALRGRDLRPGPHELRIGPSKLTLVTLETLGVITAPGTASLGHVLRRDGWEFIPISSRGASTIDGPAEGMVEVIGVTLVGSPNDLPPTTPPPLLLRAKARDYIVLGARPGEFARPRAAPNPPRWVSGIPPFSAGREFVPPFEAVWVLLERSTGGWEGYLRHRWEPASFDPERTKVKDLRAWCKPFLELSPILPEGSRELWQAYRDLAAEVLI